MRATSPSHLIPLDFNSFQSYSHSKQIKEEMPNFSYHFFSADILHVITVRDLEMDVTWRRPTLWDSTHFEREIDDASPPG
jgi:hypothetical protein